MPTPPLLDRDALDRALALRDLSDPAAGPHAMQQLLAIVVQALAERWHCAVHVARAHPVVPVADNYDHLRIAGDAVTRDARYTRYVSAGTLLRSHTSAMIPPLLRAAAARPDAAPADQLLACPGLVWRRDVVDRLHTGAPHQLDLWRLRRRAPGAAALGTAALHEMIATVVGAALPGREYRAVPAEHPYTRHGVQVDVRHGDAWVEVGECGLAHPEVLARAGLDPRTWSGLAMGLGLDRLLMLVKGIDDIRLLRSSDPRVAAQLLDLAPYRAVSNQPPVRRDLSVAVAADRTAEELGDRVRGALGDAVDALEEMQLLAETHHAVLPPAAAARMGMTPAQKNVLLRLVIRHPTRTLTHAEANRLRDAVYAAVHEGMHAEWASR